jgi:plasmid maintenance system antidote protein VapI
MTKQTVKLELLLTENAISVEEFANCMGIDLSLAEAICQGSKKISKSLARQIEQTFSKPNLWLEIDDDNNGGPNYDLFG